MFKLNLILTNFFVLMNIQKDIWKNANQTVLGHH